MLTKINNTNFLVMSLRTPVQFRNKKILEGYKKVQK